MVSVSWAIALFMAGIFVGTFIGVVVAAVCAINHVVELEEALERLQCQQSG